MHIGAIQTLEFRNHRTLSWSPSPKLNFLSGANAQGKTNLLEALGFLLDRSFLSDRTLGGDSVLGNGSRVGDGELHRDAGTRTVRRTIERLESGAWQSAGDDCPWARAVALAGRIWRSLNGAPVARRNFLDGPAARLYSSHRAALVRYRQILVRRNQLLAGPRRRAGSRPGMSSACDGRNRADRPSAAGRGRAPDGVGAHLPFAGWRSGQGRDPLSGVAGRSDGGGRVPGRAQPGAPGRAPARADLVGPHRDDLAIEIDGMDARTFGSRGQQRLLALALRLAEVLPITREVAGTAPGATPG